MNEGRDAAVEAAIGLYVQGRRSAFHLDPLDRSCGSPEPTFTDILQRVLNRTRLLRQPRPSERSTSDSCGRSRHPGPRAASKPRSHRLKSCARYNETPSQARLLLK